MVSSRVQGQIMPCAGRGRAAPRSPPASGTGSPSRRGRSAGACPLRAGSRAAIAPGARSGDSRPAGRSPRRSPGSRTPSTPEVLAAGELPSLGPSLAVHLDDVHREVDDRGVADGGPHPVRVGVAVQLEDLALVDAPETKSFTFLKPRSSSSQRTSRSRDAKVAAPVRGGVQAHGREPVPQELRCRDGPELLVLEGVHERHPWDPRVHRAVETPPGPLLSQDEREGVRHRADGIEPDHFRALHDRHPVAAADVRGPLDHRAIAGCMRRDRRSRRAGSGREAHARRGRRDAARLAEQARSDVSSVPKSRYRPKSTITGSSV